MCFKDAGKTETERNEERSKELIEKLSETAPKSFVRVFLFFIDFLDCLQSRPQTIQFFKCWNEPNIFMPDFNLTNLTALNQKFRHFLIYNIRLENKNLRIMFLVNISNHSQYFRNRIFAIGWFFN